MYFITTKRMLEVCFSAHPNIQYRTYCFVPIIITTSTPNAIIKESASYVLMLYHLLSEMEVTQQ